MELITIILQILMMFTDDGTTETSTPYQGKVVGITDGDTITVKSNGKEYTIRLLGIDAPETGPEANPEEYNATKKCLNKMDDKATAYIRKHLLGKQVQIIYDSQAGIQGPYDRYLGEVYVNMNGTEPILWKHRKKNFNMNILAEGYARFYDEENYEMRRIGYYTGMESTAKMMRSGIWSCN